MPFLFQAGAVFIKFLKLVILCSLETYYMILFWMSYPHFHRKVRVMETPSKTVHVEDFGEFPAVKMTWQREVNYPDLSDAFRKIEEKLNNSVQPLYVVVDITRNPNFPLNTTVAEAAAGPYRNPKLVEWLVIGSNLGARMIERLLSSITGRHNVRWFKSEAEVTAYLQNQFPIETGSTMSTPDSQ